MTKKKKFVLTAVAIIPIVLAVLLFGLPRREHTASIPISPDKVTDVGRYYLDDTRFIEIKKSADGLEYWEGRQQSDDTDSALPQVVSYSASEIKSVRLESSWAIEFTRPDRLLITFGTGEVVERIFGEDSPTGDPEPTNTTVTRHRRIEAEAEQAAPSNR